MSDRPIDAERAAGAERSAKAVRRLDEITRRLRVECPWDREQDERSIVPHTVDEAYELADAAMSGDDAKLLDELGDVLFQVHFLALLLEERGAGDLAAVAEQMTAKLVRRHPHVFGDAEADTGGEVLAHWDRVKREREGRRGLFEDVPENLPGLLYARKLQRRAAARAAAQTSLGPIVGGEGPEGAIAALRESAERLEADGVEDGAAAAGDGEQALGELLFAAVDLARRMGCDPELALRAAAERFAAAVRHSEGP